MNSRTAVAAQQKGVVMPHLHLQSCEATLLMACANCNKMASYTDLATKCYRQIWHFLTLCLNLYDDLYTCFRACWIGNWPNFMNMKSRRLRFNKKIFGFLWMHYIYWAIPTCRIYQLYIVLIKKYTKMTVYTFTIIIQVNKL